MIQPHVGDDADEHVARLELAQREARIVLAVGADAVLVGVLGGVVGVGEARLLLDRLLQPLLARPALCLFLFVLFGNVSVRSHTSKSAAQQATNEIKKTDNSKPGGVLNQ